MSIPGADNIGFILGAWGVALLLLILFAWAYRRGKRVLAAPSCRACGYDVSMRPADSTRCSECGADLTAPRAIQTHAYRRRWWAIAPLLLALAVGIVALQASRRFQWRACYIAHAPTSFIIHHAEADHTARGEDMRKEWYRRNQQMPRLFEHLLDVQKTGVLKSPSLSYKTLERALLDGTLTQAQQDRYLDQILPSIKLEVPPRVYSDTAIPFKVTLDAKYGEELRYEFLWGYSVDDEEVAVLSNRILLFLPGGFSGRMHEGSTINQQRDPGPHTFNLKVGIRLIRPRLEDPLSPYLTRAVSVPFEIVADDTPLVTESSVPKRDEEKLARAVHFSISPGTTPQLRINLLPAPVGRAFVVNAILDDGTAIRLGEVTAVANAAGRANLSLVPLKTHKGDSITVELVANEGGAHRIILGDPPAVRRRPA